MRAGLTREPWSVREADVIALRDSGGNPPL